MNNINLTAAYKELASTEDAIKAEKDRHESEMTTLRGKERRLRETIAIAGSGLDHDKIATAESILRVSDYSKGGEDRRSCVTDAIKQFTTGAGLGPYTDLWRHRFGTKSYDRWHGQRSDHEYGYGPSHGSIIFSVEVLPGVRNSRKQSELSTDEVEACLYYLTNIERIQSARATAKAA